MTMATATDKSAALAMAIRQIESSFGKGAVMQLGSTYVSGGTRCVSFTDSHSSTCHPDSCALSLL